LVTLGFGQIDINGVILGAYDEFILSFVENGILRCNLKSLIIFVNGFYVFRFVIVVKLEKLIIFEEKKSIGVIFVELELHTGVRELPVT
jgi:hypothetical protein